ncbi:MAG: hypothetical protein JJ953_11240 [Gracilimonas sp.]|uniref:hypothetical protein n=1 Tax=Gracilimonas TaxID=649462 RepID=UPI001B1AF663|nr:hypothetical protein [Gracilimonas sp.]MBO6586671.1 hypothetical protein [Gracilimonas sp.]MBO6615328.1 hypothetical protein [Gracilimonas sp.]
MKLISPLSHLLIVSTLFFAGCSSSTSLNIDELLDGKFTAKVEDGSSFDGNAFFEIEIPTDGFQNVLEDSVLFLTLKTGEITNTREINGETTEYTINIGLTLNSLWETDADELELGSTFFQNIFVHPNTLDSQGIKSGTIYIDEKTDDLLVGSFRLVTVISSDTESNITGEFRATRKD